MLGERAKIRTSFYLCTAHVTENTSPRLKANQEGTRVVLELDWVIGEF